METAGAVRLPVPLGPRLDRPAVRLGFGQHHLDILPLVPRPGHPSIVAGGYDSIGELLAGTGLSGAIDAALVLLAADGDEVVTLDRDESSASRLVRPPRRAAPSLRGGPTS